MDPGLRAGRATRRFGLRRGGDGPGLRVRGAWHGDEVLVGVLVVEQAAREDPGARLHPNARHLRGVEELAALDAQGFHPGEPLAVHEDAPQGVGEELYLLRVEDAATPAGRRARERVAGG